MFMNRSEKSLLSAAWLAALLMAMPVWSAMYLLNQPDMDPSWPMHAPLIFLQLTILYPVLEEVVFRGFIQGEFIRKPVFRRQYRGITSANVLTSLLFAAAHLFAHPLAMAMLVFLPSLIFGYFRDRYDGWLLPAILLHIYYNAGYFLIFKPAL